MMSNYRTKAYACYNKCDEIRRISTSGGIFYLIAKYILKDFHGYVCGAMFDENFRVVHKIVNDEEGVLQLLGSKYPQSKIGDCFIQIKKLLNNKEVVLFCGTPCQVNALRCFLRKEYSNLYLVDFVCHGVASPKIWEDYLENYCDKNNLISVRFKDKIRGWKNWHVKMVYKNKSRYSRGQYDLFMKSYLRRINVRPSCYECQFKGIDRVSDLTIADCWGIGERNLNLNDDKGLSAVLIHNVRGEQIFNSFISSLVYEEYEPKELMSENWACTKSVETNTLREKFYKDYKRYGIRKTFDIYFKLSYIENVKYSIKRIIGKEL